MGFRPHYNNDAYTSSRYASHASRERPHGRWTDQRSVSTSGRSEQSSQGVIATIFVAVLLTYKGILVKSGFTNLDHIIELIYHIIT